MARRTDFRKANSYTGQKINGWAEIAYKIDGVRILSRDHALITRNNLEPPGLDLFLDQSAKDKIRAFGDCEVYKHGKNFHYISGNLNSYTPPAGAITANEVYPLDYDEPGSPHCYDERLLIGAVFNPKPYFIKGHLKDALELGYEGLVIRTKDRWYRVKPDYTADVYITGWFEQFDKAKKPKGILGGFTTDYGKVTAFSEALRVQLWNNPEQYVGKMMTVKYKELYESGSFRYAVTFLHFRHDKSEESFDTKAL